ncbi:hypothetical protein [Amphritea sp. HPY]|uniref:hypothetical protein n=1 Tax=Amphritea sp. HPY TaxID=3421652 RepID=UPI003D7E61F9
MNNAQEKPSLRLAIAAQSLYLINLLLLPGVTLIALLYMAWRYRNDADQLGSCHLRQSAIVSGWFILLVVGGGLLLWFILGSNPTGLSMTLLYLIVMHTGFVLLGIIGLARAISGQHFHPTPKTSCTA